jgi:hypothetical protein
MLLAVLMVIHDSAFVAVKQAAAQNERRHYTGACLSSPCRRCIGSFGR